MSVRRRVIVVSAIAMALSACSATLVSSDRAVEVRPDPPTTSTSGTTDAPPDTVTTDPVTTGTDVTTPTSQGSTGTTATSPASTSTPSASTAPPGDSLIVAQKPSWTSCSAGLQCARVKVPLDYSKPKGATISLAVQRRRADSSSRRIGPLLVNPGGPGVPGTQLTEQASLVYSSELLDRFDIVAWDPRGTGASNAVDCFDNLDDYYMYDLTPDNAAEIQRSLDLAKQWAEACRSKAGTALLAHISTAESARDIDEIRKYLGETKISWFGFSYGSELGATYASLFGSHLRATVLDASVDPTSDYTTQVLAASKTQDALVQRILDRCSADRGCAFYNDGKAAEAYDRLMASLDATPIPATGEDSSRPKVGSGVATIATIQALYNPSLWDSFTDALADAQAGDGAGLLALYDAYTDHRPRGGFDNVIEDLYAIGCLDDPGPTTVGALQSLAQQSAAVAPRTGIALLWLDPCLYWPVPPAPQVTVTGKGAGTVLVVGSTGDPITPLDGTRNMAKALEGGTLLVRDGEGHTSYGGGNKCIDTAVDRYLTDLVAPANGTVCKD